MTRGAQFGGFFAHGGKAHDRQQIALFAEVRHGAVQDDLPGAFLAANGVGFKTMAVGHVAAEDLLVFLQAAFVHQVAGNGQAAFVFQVAAGDGGAMDFGFE